MIPVISRAAFRTSVMQLYEYPGTVLLKGSGHFTQAGHELVIVNANLVGHHFTYLVNTADAQDYSSNTSPGPFFIEIPFLL